MPSMPLTSLQEPTLAAIGPGVPSSSRRRWRELLTSYNIILAVLFLGALGIGWAVLPGEDERIEALERDGQTGRALALLEARYERGDRRQHTLRSLKRFYDYYGNTDKSLKMLELLVEQRPKDPFLLRQLVQTHKELQDEPGQIKALKAQLTVRYDEPVCQRLIGLLRRSNDFSGEQAMLIACRNNGYRRQEDLERLAFLYAADGNLGQAGQILSAVDDRRWLRGSRERLMLFEALLATDQSADAMRRGVRWYRGQANTDFALEMITKMINAGRSDLALQMVRDLGKPGDAVALAAGEILVDQVQYAPARSFLTGWLGQVKTMSLETAARFVTAAVDAESPLLALQGAERFGLERFRPDDLPGLAEALMAAGQIESFDKVRPYLSAQVVAQSRLLLAAIDLREGRADVARAVLAATPVDPQDERRLALKSRLLSLAGRPLASDAALVREPTRSDIQLAPPLVVTRPGEVQTKRLGASDIAKRFKRVRPQGTAKGAAAQGKAAPQQPGFAAPPFAVGQ